MQNFRRLPVNSSLITSIAYDSSRNALEVVFCKGGIYEYSPVSSEQFQALYNAGSVGEYFNNEIRPKTPVKKVRD